MPSLLRCGMNVPITAVTKAVSCDFEVNPQGHQRKVGVIKEGSLQFPRGAVSDRELVKSFLAHWHAAKNSGCVRGSSWETFSLRRECWRCLWCACGGNAILTPTFLSSSVDSQFAPPRMSLVTFGESCSSSPGRTGRRDAGTVLSAAVVEGVTSLRHSWLMEPSCTSCP